MADQFLMFTRFVLGHQLNDPQWKVRPTAFDFFKGFQCNLASGCLSGEIEDFVNATLRHGTQRWVHDANGLADTGGCLYQ